MIINFACMLSCVYVIRGLYYATINSKIIFYVFQDLQGSDILTALIFFSHIFFSLTLIIWINEQSNKRFVVASAVFTFHCIWIEEYF